MAASATVWRRPLASLKSLLVAAGIVAAGLTALPAAAQPIDQDGNPQTGTLGSTWPRVPPSSGGGGAGERQRVVPAPIPGPGYGGRYYGGGGGYYGGDRYYNGGGYYRDRYYDDGPRYQYRTYQPRTYQRRVGGRHVEWCYDRYRSYRASDNSYQPNYGPRRQCVSPYS